MNIIKIHTHEHLLDKQKPLRDCIRSENNKTQTNNHRHINTSNEFRKFFNWKNFFQHKETAMKHPPCYKSPIRTMPQAGCKKDNHFIHHRAKFSFTVSPQRNIKIFSKPCRKRNMPSSPKLLHRSGNIRIVEIFKE